MKNISLVLILLLSSNLFSAEKIRQSAFPKKFYWGGGFLGLNTPHYRGSDQTKFYFLPIPYFVYRGDKVELENSSLTAGMFKMGELEFGASANVSLPVESSDNEARSGMPDLDPLVEIGPMLSWYFGHTSDKVHQFSFHAPIRRVFRVNFWDVRQTGYFSVPYFSWRAFPFTKYKLFSQMTLAWMYGDKTYHSYYYRVAPNHVTANRPFYDARGGYHGAHWTWFLSKRYKQKQYFFTFFRYDWLKGSVIENSPLVKTNGFFMMGLGWTMFFNM